MATAEGKLPNFFIVGVPKAGTTSLYHHLSQHPDVYMSPLKETSYFSPEMRIELLAPELRALGDRSAQNLRKYLDSPSPLLEPYFGGVVTGWADYCRLFKGVGEETAIGEATPGYLWSQTAATRIAARFPEARIIAILRNPADRAFSQYLQMSNTGTYRVSFQAHLGACLASSATEEINMLHPFLEYGLYAAQLHRYRDVFPAAQIGVWLYEDTRRPCFLGDVFEFLGVDRSFRPDTSKRYLEQRVPRTPYLNRILQRPGVAAGLRSLVPQPMRSALRSLVYRSRGSVAMSNRERSMLIDHYREDIGKLEGMLGKDLSGWLGSPRTQ